MNQLLNIPTWFHFIHSNTRVLLTLSWTRFQTNNTLIFSHGPLNNVAWYKHIFWFKAVFIDRLRASCSRVALHAQLFDTIKVKINCNWCKFISNVILYSAALHFHRKLLVKIIVARRGRVGKFELLTTNSYGGCLQPKFNSKFYVWSQGARTICLCSRLLFYSKCSGFTICLTCSDMSLTIRGGSRIFF